MKNTITVVIIKEKIMHTQKAKLGVLFLDIFSSF